MSERRGGDTHHLAGWLLIVVALLAAAVGVAVRWWPDRLAHWTGQTIAQLSDWWLPGAMGLVCLTALAVGLRLAAQRRPSPVLAKRAAGGPESDRTPPPPSPAPAVPQAAPAVPRTAAQATAASEPAEAEAFWPADRAVGLGWARAADAAPAATPDPTSLAP
ncbi:MAG: hypothetical protein LBK42_12995, partial [Propionibacteriaceae bacterium]|nr:hypothetical protein [Propionibacteriaceae bacterium]